MKEKEVKFSVASVKEENAENKVSRNKLKDKPKKEKMMDFSQLYNCALELCAFNFYFSSLKKN